MYVANSDSQSISRYVTKERQHATEELAAFLAANDLQDKPWSFRVEEGTPMEVISNAVTP